MAQAPVLDLEIEGGSGWTMVCLLKDDNGNPKPLTGYTAKMHFRERVTSPIVKELATGAGITIDEPNGKITVVMTGAETAALGNLKGVYDLFLYTASLAPEKLVKGTVTVFPPVTR